MNNVLPLAFVLGCILAIASQPARADSHCALGWICETASSFEFLGPFAIEGTSNPICSLRHGVRLKRQNLEFIAVASFYKANTKAEFSFILGLVQVNQDGTRNQVLLGDGRLFSADRTIDTRSWIKTIVPETNLLVLTIQGVAATSPIATTAMKTATGTRYGALIETQIGQRLQLEIEIGRPTESDRAAIRAFRDCMARGHLPIPPDSDRG